MQDAMLLTLSLVIWLNIGWPAGDAEPCAAFGGKRRKREWEEKERYLMLSCNRESAIQANRDASKLFQRYLDLAIEKRR